MPTESVLVDASGPQHPASAFRPRQAPAASTNRLEQAEVTIKARLTSILILLGLLAASPALVHADVIEYDPRADEVPQILDSGDMDRYDALRGAGISRLNHLDMSPGGKQAIINRGSQLEAYDTASGAMKPIGLLGLSLSSGLHWTSDTTAVALLAKTYNDRSTPWEYFRGAIDIGAGTVTTTTLSVPNTVLRGTTLNANIRGGEPQVGADGKLYLFALSQAGGGLLADRVIEYERPSYDGRTDEERAAVGESVEPTSILQQAIMLSLYSLDDGSLREVAEIPAGTNLGTAYNSAELRPGHDTVAFISDRSFPWAGQVINGRASRGGGMPNSYWNVQENLGNVPEGENLWILSTTLHWLDLAAGERKDIPNAEHLPGKFSDILWTADGEHLMVRLATPSVLEGRENPIYEYSAGTALRRFAPDGTDSGETWARVGMDADSTQFYPQSGTEALVMYGKNTTRHLALVDLADASAEPRGVYEGDDMLYSFAYRDGGLSVSLGSAADPGESHVSPPPAAGAERSYQQISSLNDGLRAISKIAYAPFEYTTSSGYDLGGVYVYPAEWGGPPSEPKPAIVWQQGGPGGQMYNTWGNSVESPYSMLPNFGIPVIIVNGVGRTSNGQKFYSDMADGTNYGQRDIRDVKEAVEHLIGLGWVKADAVGVTGCSYGGYFTLQSLVEYPNLYAAGNSQCSLNDMMYEFNFGWSPFLAYLIGGTPTGLTREFIKDSPTYNANKIEVPLLQFHGTGDFLFFEHITNIHDQVAANGVPSRFFRPTGYGHGIGNIGGVANSGANGQRFAFQLQLDWFRTHLGLQGGLRFDDAAVARYDSQRFLARLESSDRQPVPGPMVPELR
jgi:dipeptidyl aminopeptidase/acylaminoacyl peptidase